MSFYKVDREKFLRNKPIEKRLSSNVIKYPLRDVGELYSQAVEFLIKHSSTIFKRTTYEDQYNFNWVSDTDSSFCSMNKNLIQIGLKQIFNSNFEPQQRVDSAFAVCLHEMYHKRYTIKDVKKEFLMEPKIGTDELYDLMATFFHDKLQKDKRTAKIAMSVFNILEDYRIEKLGMRDFPGYVFFFDELRSLCTVLHAKKDFSTILTSSVVIEFLMMKILLPELLPTFMEQYENFLLSSTSMDCDALVPLRIMGIINDCVEKNKDLVYSDSVADMFLATEKIISVIPNDFLTKLNNELTSLDKSFSSLHEDFVSENENNKFSPSKDDLKKMNKAIGDETKKLMMNGDSDGSDSSRTEKIIALNANNNIFREVLIVNSKPSGFDGDIWTRANNAGKNIVRDLGYLAARMNQRQIDYELTEGDLDEDEIYIIKHSQDIFKEESERPGYELDVAILLDESGSMGGKEKIRNAIIACLSIAISVQKASHINLFIYGHSEGRQVRNGSCIEMYEYYNSLLGVKNIMNIFSAVANGSNADGYAIAKMGEIMLGSKNRNKKLMIVISDGQPAATGYGGMEAMKHVRMVVDDLDRKGIDVIQVAVDNIKDSQMMFKEFIKYDESGDYIKEIGNILRKKLMQIAAQI